MIILRIYEMKLDKEQKIMSIRDRGIRMTNEDLIKDFKTNTKTGTYAFVEKMQTVGDFNLIGRVLLCILLPIMSKSLASIMITVHMGV
ncbi:hypothetical protein MKX03_025709 [Papaver bracteatum]|nr:hypothetical protein MKX03_025709 [Papaver bracteatum]